MERDRARHHPEHTPSGPERGGESHEDERPAYYQAARFRGERPAGRAYQQAQDLVYRDDVELSAFRFHIQQVWHVAVVGEEPPEDIHQQLAQILSVGESTTLPQDVLTLLFERRSQAAQLGPWVEGHYQPGRRYRLPDRDGGERP